MSVCHNIVSGLSKPWAMVILLISHTAGMLPQKRDLRDQGDEMRGLLPTRAFRIFRNYVGFGLGR